MNQNQSSQEVKLTPFKRLFRMLSLDKREILIIYAYAIFNGLINLSLPLGVQAIIGFVISAEYSASLSILIFIVVLGVAAAGIIQILQLSLTELLQRRIFARSSFEFAYRIPRFKMESISGFYAPELMNRFFDTLNIQKGLSKILIDVSSSTLQIIFGLLLLSLYHPFFVFFGITLVSLVTLIFFLTGPKGLKTSILESKYKYQVAHWLEELARVMGTFKLAGKTDLPIDKMNEYVGNYLKFRKQHFHILILQFSNIVGFKTVITAGLLILGSILVINQEINLGQFVASEIIILLVLSSVEKLILSMETVYDVLTGIEKLGQVTDIEMENEDGIDLEAMTVGKKISVELSNLTFSYPSTTSPAIQNLNLKVEAGEKVCITGVNQSGKSTLIALISGLYSHYDGSIMFNGVPLSNLNTMSFRSVIGDNLSMQDLFYGTLAENITVGKKQIDTADILWAIKQVGLSEYFKELTKGLNTMIQPEGQGLSSSVRQKIILARTIAERPKIIVMDNTLQGLEFTDRKLISTILTSPEQPWTLLAVTNDPLMMNHSDKIVTMEKGNIVDIKEQKPSII
ncbi:ABC-type bacteriocin/lantibiotic exporter, contains an N-terminal double-glycine peptidase domain [Reichenbachiella agariperforans]|uniref:ABC-type bacteriocin/lantibiotic exporter, contains an N-terminal double-glycine peptidase domain n=1 Tax=Reichenbachiella agariperforans TaxID=156994 RepID=A0A1M6PY96_REIAG|nr:ATP-binding cassette domain-containing protein [Reichenbachiella agariperforans]SHK12933.1 ABC-type bacteriocin/lantibiotic exporter, contains an N-terminal double-glycine peptidase domain [Reichenbachiella agariperforans]